MASSKHSTNTNAVKHRTLKVAYTASCRLGNDAVHKTVASGGGKRQLVESERDPELVKIVEKARRYGAEAGPKKAGKPLPAACPVHCGVVDCLHAQTREWCWLRDAYAAKNYNLPYRAAQLRWKVNRHLPRERVPCNFCPGRPTCDPRTLVVRRLTETEVATAAAALKNKTTTTGGNSSTEKPVPFGHSPEAKHSGLVLAIATPSLPPAWGLFQADGKLLSAHATDKEAEGMREAHQASRGVCRLCLTGCNRCLNTGTYWAQPDLERLAYTGLLEAIRKCDFACGGNRISTYAVWLMKQAMMPLLRQTPVFYPQELLRDRRVVAELRRAKVKAAVEIWRITHQRRPNKKEVQELCIVLTPVEIDAALLGVRKCKRGETLEQRRLLVEGCYYGQDKSSVELLQSRFVERSDRSEKKQRRGKASVAVEALTTAPLFGNTLWEGEEKRPDAEFDALAEVVDSLPTSIRRVVQQYLRGTVVDLPPTALEALRAVML